MNKRRYLKPKQCPRSPLKPPFQRIKRIQTNQSPSAPVDGQAPAASLISQSGLPKGFSRDTIAEAVATIDVGAVVTSLLKSKREKTLLETLIFVRDTVIGRPAQNVSLSGGLLHAHTLASFAKSNRIKASHQSGRGGVCQRELVERLVTC
jgi:hypothetical protein